MKNYLGGQRGFQIICPSIRFRPAAPSLTPGVGDVFGDHGGTNCQLKARFIDDDDDPRGVITAQALHCAMHFSANTDTKSNKCPCYIKQLQQCRQYIKL